MPRQSILLLLVLALAACQAGNPYTAQSLPYPPAPAAAANPTLDPGSYPAAPLDYGQYRSWNWSSTADANGAYGTPLQDAISQQLDQLGLRPARPGNAPDLQVSAEAHNEQRTRQVTDYYSASYGYYGWHDPWYGYGAAIPVTRTYNVMVGVLRIDLLDARNGQRVWSGSAEFDASGSQREQDAALREAARQALAGYPPY
ncbi:hypothetical protein D3C81_1081470 [compost metagenome]